MAVVARERAQVAAGQRRHEAARDLVRAHDVQRERALTASLVHVAQEAQLEVGEVDHRGDGASGARQRRCLHAQQRPGVGVGDGVGQVCVGDARHPADHARHAPAGGQGDGVAAHLHRLARPRRRPRQLEQRAVRRRGAGGLTVDDEDGELREQHQRTRYAARAFRSTGRALHRAARQNANASSR
jgi:hypothetical protein